MKTFVAGGIPFNTPDWATFHVITESGNIIAYEGVPFYHAPTKTYTLVGGRAEHIGTLFYPKKKGGHHEVK